MGGTLDEGDPRVVGLYLESGGSAGICTGIWVAPRIVVTAAHCLDADGPGPLPTATGEVYFGTVIDGAHARTEPFLDVGTHPLWAGNAGAGHDIGAIVLPDTWPLLGDLPVTASLTQVDAQPGASVRVVGFGLSRADFLPSAGVKRAARMPIRDVLADPPLLVYGDSEHTICYGDSGAPVFLTVDGPEVLVGISSFMSFPDEPCTDRGNAALYEEHRDWLNLWLAERAPRTCLRNQACSLGCPAPDPDCPCVRDGHCTAACSEPATDPDCPAGCGRNGRCVGTGCAAPDPDCAGCGAGGGCVHGCVAHDPDSPGRARRRHLRARRGLRLATLRARGR